MFVHSLPGVNVNHLAHNQIKNNSCYTRNSHGEFFKMGDQALGRTRQDVPLSMMALA